MTAPGASAVRRGDRGHFQAGASNGPRGTLQLPPPLHRDKNNVKSPRRDSMQQVLQSLHRM